MSRRGHVMVVPSPAQGHVAPLMKFAYKVAKTGLKVTFVNADFIHSKIVSAMASDFRDKIPVNLVSVPTDPATNHGDRIESHKSLAATMLCNLQRLIEELNAEQKVDCVVADITAWWAIEVAHKLGIKRASLVPFSSGTLALNLSASKLIESGIISSDGIPFKDDELIYLSNDTTPWNSNELTWRIPNQPEDEKFVFRHFVLRIKETAKISDWVLVNSFYELEQPYLDLIPKAIPVGPLTMKDHKGPFPGNFWEEDPSCLKWLDQQPENSVIFAAFGSSAICNSQQFLELAHALELIGQPFLWVVRPNFTKGAEFPEGFEERIASYGKIVEWAPQEKVLSHPSVCCFFSHCGWNSTIEGVSKGVPFLCWPYFTDQFRNTYYICETWKVGLRVLGNQNGMVSRHEIKSKIEKLVGDEDIKANSLKLKDMAAKSTSKDGLSFQNFMSFIEQTIH